MKNKKYEFWISNVTNMNVTLRDLHYSVPARCNKNLLDERHFNYTLEELQKSKESGSLYKKRDRIKVREVPPEKPIKPGPRVSKEPLFLTKNPLHSRVELIEPVYEELQISESDVAEELSLEDLND